MIGFLRSLFMSPQKRCHYFYQKAKAKRPGKPEKDYLKIVLLTLPPFDYMLDEVIEEVLNKCLTIEKLARYIPEGSKSLWTARKRNMSEDYIRDKLKRRNEGFFLFFWGSEAKEETRRGR